jgi:predicted PolB exonuclease-like 3'-5' exonuclease
VLGKDLVTLVNENKTPGSYVVTFNGNGFSSGVYFYQLKSGSFIETKKFLLLK